MMQSLRIAATGMHAQQTNVDVLANNIANINTAGFKRQQTQFQDLVYQDKIGVGAITTAGGDVAPTGAQQGLGVRIAGFASVQTQGPVENTGNTFDMAVQGDGYFRVTLADGTTGYTRDGSFTVNQNGDLVNPQGYLFDPGINVPIGATQYTVSETGIVSAKINDVVTQLGQITLSMFVNPAGLDRQGNNLFKETIASGAPTDANPTENGAGGLLQSHIEKSNVDPIESVTELITAQRAYELNSRVISTADEMLGAINQI